MNKHHWKLVQKKNRHFKDVADWRTETQHRWNTVPDSFALGRITISFHPSAIQKPSTLTPVGTLKETSPLLICLHSILHVCHFTKFLLAVYFAFLCEGKTRCFSHAFPIRFMPHSVAIPEREREGEQDGKRESDRSNKGKKKRQYTSTASTTPVGSENHPDADQWRYIYESCRLQILPNKTVNKEEKNEIKKRECKTNSFCFMLSIMTGAASLRRGAADSHRACLKRMQLGQRTRIWVSWNSPSLLLKTHWRKKKTDMLN